MKGLVQKLNAQNPEVSSEQKELIYERYKKEVKEDAKNDFTDFLTHFKAQQSKVDKTVFVLLAFKNKKFIYYVAPRKDKEVDTDGVFQDSRRNRLKSGQLRRLSR